MSIRRGIFFLLAICPVVYAEPAINGVWKQDCERNRSAIYVSEGRPTVMLEAFHAYIYVSYTTDANGVVNIFFDGVADTGPGARGVAWSHIDKRKAVGTFKFLNVKKAVLKWFGFKSKSGEKVEVYSDFSTETDNTMERCR